MKTLARNLRVTNNELLELNSLFRKEIILVRKIKLYGDGHCQLPDVFGLTGNVDLFWEEHETTHAKFIFYRSIIDIENDNNISRIDLVPTGQEFLEWLLPLYEF